MRYVFQTVGAFTFFSVYQVLIKRSGLNWSTALLCMGVGFFIVAIPVNLTIYLANPGISLKELMFRPDVPMPVSSFSRAPLVAAIALAMALGVTAGMLNGGGHVFYQQLIATPLKDLSSITVTIPMGCVIMGFATAITFNGEKLTRNKAGAIIAAGIAIWLAGRE